MGEPRPTERTTRRGGDETSFGVVGRITITVVLAMAFLALVAFTVSAGVLFLYPTAVIPGALLCAWILKDTWRAVPVNGPRYRAPMTLADVTEAVRLPSFREMSPGRRAGILVAIVGGVAIMIAYLQLRPDIQVGAMMFVGLLGAGLPVATVLRR